MKAYKIIILALFVALFSGQSLLAQPPMDKNQRQRAIQEMRQYKHSVITKELDLKKDQQEKFFELYDAMENELMTLGEETRELERKTINDANATDAQNLAAARALFELKKKESEIELKYYDSFAEVLTPRQLLKLKSAERKSAMHMASYHGRVKHQRNAQGKNGAKANGASKTK